MSFSLTGPLTFLTMVLEESSTNSTRTWVTPPLEPVLPNTLMTLAKVTGVLVSWELLVFWFWRWKNFFQIFDRKNEVLFSHLILATRSRWSWIKVSIYRSSSSIRHQNNLADNSKTSYSSKLVHTIFACVLYEEMKTSKWDLKKVRAPKHGAVRGRPLTFC